jgi:hypothetical protein
MKRAALVILSVAALGLSVLAGSAAAENAANAKAADLAEAKGLRDPGFIYGFVSLTDPKSGKKHVKTIYSMARNREVPADRPTWFVRFRSTVTGDSYDLRFENGEGMLAVGAPPFALSYGLRLIPDQKQDYPRLVIGRDSRIVFVEGDKMLEVPRNRAVYYNPLAWRFEMVGMDGEASPDPYKNLKRRASPFPDIPDAPVRKE